MLDGEGCIAIVRRQKKSNSPSYEGVIVFANNDRRCLEAIQSWYGGKIYSKKITEKTISVGHSLRISAHDSARMLKDILPFIIIKKDQAENWLQFYQHKRKYRGTRVSAETIQALTQYYETAKQLKGSGFQILKPEHGRNKGAPIKKDWAQIITDHGDRETSTTRPTP